MGFHVLHVFQHGATLAKERGFIVCRSQEGGERRLPHEDIRAVIVAARGVTLTSRFVSAILEGDGIIVHCDERYQPCGITSSLDRVVDRSGHLRPAQTCVILRQVGKLEGALGLHSSFFQLSLLYSA
jgi:CRISPR-associated protein Cas1